MSHSNFFSHKNHEQALPLWAQRLGHSGGHLLESPSWPSTPEEGLRQSLALSDLGHRQLIERTRLEHPNMSTEAVHEIIYRQICAWQQLRSTLRFRPSK
jgi:hypothetical protein